MTDPGKVAPFEVVQDHVVEPKVIASTYGAGAAGVVSAFLLWALDELFFDGYEIGAEVPLPVVSLVLLAVPSAITFLAGYYSRHVNRPGG